MAGELNMNNNDIKKLGRAELLELLIAQVEENKELKTKLADVETQLADRRIIMEKCGSIAEASLHLNGIFDTAQRAAGEYLENVKLFSESREEIFRRYEEDASAMSERIIAEAERKCRLMEEDTAKKCDEMLRIARRESENYWNSVSARIEERISTPDGGEDE